MKYLAGIVTFNPDIKRLSQNLAAVKNQVNDVLIVDNHSANSDEIEKLCTAVTVKLKKLEENKGVAFALNYIGQYAIEHSFDWFLTLDQDTVVVAHLLSEYSNYTSLPSVGMLTSIFQDVNEKQVLLPQGDYEETKLCITSGAFMKTKSFENSKGFDNQLFIDFVDYDLNLHYLNLGYKIYRIHFIGFYHEIGEKTVRYLFSKPVYVFNHSAIRHYYMTRNTLYLSKKYGKNAYTKRFIRANQIEILKVLLYEKDKWKKIKASVKGFIDGRRMRV